MERDIATWPAGWNGSGIVVSHPPYRDDCVLSRYNSSGSSH